MDKAKNTLDLQGCEAMRDWRDHICDFANHIATGDKRVKFFWRKKNSNIPYDQFFFDKGFFNSLENNTFIGFSFWAGLSHNVPCTYHSTQNTTTKRCRLHTYFGFTFILPRPLTHQWSGTPQLFLLLSFLFNTKSRWKID